MPTPNNADWLNCCAFLAQAGHTLLLAIVENDLPDIPSAVDVFEGEVQYFSTPQTLIDELSMASAAGQWMILWVTEPVAEVVWTTLVDVLDARKIPVTTKIILAVKQSDEQFIPPEISAKADVVYRE